MPTYEYKCKSCGHTFEIVQSMRDDTLTVCPECGGELRKVFAPPAISFKGSGFYATDHRKKGSSPSTEKADQKTEKSDQKTEKRDDKKVDATSDKGSGDATTKKADQKAGQNTGKKTETKPAASGSGGGSSSSGPKAKD